MTAASSSGLDFTPAPGAAPAARRVLRHGLTETLLMVRNGEQLLLALVIPIGVLIIGKVLDNRWVGDQLPSSVLALAVWSTSFTSIAISTGFERRYGVLERLASTPLGRSGLLTGKALAVVIVVLGQLLILTVVSVLLGWRPEFTVLTVLQAIAAVVLAIVAFVSLALILAGRLRAESTLALANVIYVAGLVAGGLVFPPELFGEPMTTVVRLLPTGALGEALRQSAVGVLDGVPLLVLACWSVLLILLARKAFRWIS